jgi:hypothetical protein
MEIKIFDSGAFSIAELISEQIEINDQQDTPDIIADAGYRGANRLIVYEQNLHPDFFDLKTRLAGEILQKFSTYHAYLTIVGDFSKYPSKSLKDFIYESNEVGRISFVATKEEALQALTKKP